MPKKTLNFYNCHNSKSKKYKHLGIMDFFYLHYSDTLRVQ